MLAAIVRVLLHMLQYRRVSQYEHLGTRQKEVERGVKLKEARIGAGLGRRRASRCIGMGVPQLYRYEAGLLRPGYEVAMRISLALGLDPWHIDEFRHALDRAADAGLIARPGGNPRNDQKQS